MTESMPPRSQARWWVLGGIFAATIIAKVAVRSLSIHDETLQEWRSLQVTFISAGFLLLWVILFSRLSWTLRIGCLLIGVGAFVGAKKLFPDQGTQRQSVTAWKGGTPADEPEDTTAWDYKLPMLKPTGADAIAVDLKTTTPQDYPRFLGADELDTVKGIELANDWTKQTPHALWRQPIGAGLSSFSIVGKYAVTQEQRGSYELVSCYELTSGHVLWVHQDKCRFSESQGGDGPRATPTIYDGKVYALGATGILNCLDGNTGNVIWSKNILKDHNEDNLNWGKSCSPLVFDDLVVVGLGNFPDPALVAYNRTSGEEVWKAGHDPASYSSPILATIAGVRQIVCVNTSSVTGHDPATGHILWQYRWQSAIHCSQPVPLSGDRIYLSCGYGIGSVLLHITADKDGLSANALWSSPHMKTRFTNVVYHDGYVYGLDDEILVCQDLKTGKLKWKGDRYGSGQVLLVGDVVLVMSDDGKLAMVAADPSGAHILGQFAALKGQTWNNMALSGPYLAVRNAEEAACYELPLKNAKNLPTTETASR